MHQGITDDHASTTADVFTLSDAIVSCTLLLLYTYVVSAACGVRSRERDESQDWDSVDVQRMFHT